MRVTPDEWIIVGVGDDFVIDEYSHRRDVVEEPLRSLAPQPSYRRAWGSRCRPRATDERGNPRYRAMSDEVTKRRSDGAGMGEDPLSYCPVRHHSMEEPNWLVEMPGIEPGSACFLVILLRAQPTENCRDHHHCVRQR